MKNPFKTLRTPSHLLHCFKFLSLSDKLRSPGEWFWQFRQVSLGLKGLHCVANTAELLMKGLPHERPCTPPPRQPPLPPPPTNLSLHTFMQWTPEQMILVVKIFRLVFSCISNRRTARLPHFQDWLFQKPSPSRFHINEPSALTTKDYLFFLRPLSLVSFF